MYIRVNEYVKELEGWVYSDKNGNDVYLEIGDEMFHITQRLDSMGFYKEELPLLIKALQEMQKYLEGNDAE